MGNYSGGEAAHVEGKSNMTSKNYSHVEGLGNIALTTAQHVQGKWCSYSSSYADIVGNGTAHNARSNAYTLD